MRPQTVANVAALCGLSHLVTIGVSVACQPSAAPGPGFLPFTTAAGGVSTRNVHPVEQSQASDPFKPHHYILDCVMRLSENVFT